MELCEGCVLCYSQNQKSPLHISSPVNNQKDAEHLYLDQGSKPSEVQCNTVTCLYALIPH